MEHEYGSLRGMAGVLLDLVGGDGNAEMVGKIL